MQMTLPQEDSEYKLVKKIWRPLNNWGDREDHLYPLFKLDTMYISLISWNSYWNSSRAILFKYTFAYPDCDFKS